MNKRFYLSLMFLGVGIFLLGLFGTALAQDKVIYFVQTSPANMILQLTSKDLDGFIAWEPFNAAAVKQGIGRYLVQSGEIWPNHPCCVLAASEGYRDERVLRALVWAHMKAIQFIQDPRNKAKVLEYAQQFTGKERSIVEEALQHVKFIEYPSPAEFKKFYQGLKEGRLIRKSAGDLGFQDEEGFFADFLNQKYYQEVGEALKKDPRWVPPSVPSGNKVRLGYLLQDIHQLPMFIADKEGYYAKVGLVPGKNLVLSLFANGVAVMEAFKVGDIDSAYLGGAPATLKRWNDDIKIRILMGSNDEGSALVVRKDSSIQNLRDLQGKTIAIPAVGTVQYFLLKIIANQLGYRLTLK